MTNAEKFEEVFGYKGKGMVIIMIIDCTPVRSR